MKRRNFVRALIAPAILLPLARAGEPNTEDGALYLISDRPEKYIPLLLTELRHCGLGSGKRPNLRSTFMQESRPPSFTAALNGKVIDLRRSEIASLWRAMQSESPSRRLTILEFAPTAPSSARRGAEVLVKTDGCIIDRLPLSRGAGRVYPVRGGRISVRVENGAARIEDSTCPQKICAFSPPISTAGERIICAPHRFILEIPGRGDWDTTTG